MAKASPKAEPKATLKHEEWEFLRRLSNADKLHAVYATRLNYNTLDQRKVVVDKKAIETALKSLAAEVDKRIGQALEDAKEHGEHVVMVVNWLPVPLLGGMDGKEVVPLGYRFGLWLVQPAP